MSSTNTRRNAAEVAYARERASSTLCCWLLIALSAIVVIGVFAVPPAETDAIVAHHPRPDDDDDSWPRSRSNDDDDDDDSHRHRRLSTVAEVVASNSVELKSRSLKAAPELAKNGIGAAQDHETVLKADYLGSHPRYIGCKTDADNMELRAASEISLEEARRAGFFVDTETKSASKYVERPTSHIEFDEEHGTIRFNVDVPYLSMDAAYLVSFEPFLDTESSRQWRSASDLLHVPGVCQSAPKLTAAAKYADLWAHPPSALYNLSDIPRDVTKRGGAYVVANGWKIVSRSCSRITYQWTAHAKDLTRCVASDGKSLLIALDASQNVAVASGTVWLNLLWPATKDSTAEVSYIQWAFPFSIYVDTFESKMSIIDSTRIAENVAVPMTKQEKVEAVNAAVGESVASTLDLQLRLAKWRTVTRLVHTWFSPDSDVENFAPLDVNQTGIQVERAMRVVLQVASGCTSQGVFLQEKNLEKITLAAKKQAPVYNIFGIFMHEHQVENVSSASVARKIASYGEFTVAPVGFVLSEETLVECTASTETRSVECYHNITLLLTPQHAELYQGAFDVYLCTGEVAKCNINAPDHVIHVEVAITDPSTDLETVEQLQIGVSSHLNSAAAEQLSELAFDGGDRICMQSYAIGPQQLTQSIDLRTIAAWICTDNTLSDEIVPPLPILKKLKETDDERETIQMYLKSRAEPRSGCTMLKHYVVLYGDGATTDESFNVTLHEPGSYGSWSSAICFNTSTVFVDSNGNSVHRPRQYYQTEVVAVPTEKRRHMMKPGAGAAGTIRHAHQHRSFSSFSHAAVSLRSEPHHDSIVHQSAAIRDALSERFETLTSPELGRMLRTLDAKGRITRFNSISFDVTPQTERERKLHNVHESSAVWIVFLIFLFGCIIAAPLIWLLLTRKPPEPEARSDGISTPTNSDDEK